MTPEKLYDVIAVPGQEESQANRERAAIEQHVRKQLERSAREKFEDALYKAARAQGKNPDDIIENIASALEANPKLRLTAVRKR